MTKQSADLQASQAYGALLEGIHLTGYSFERACTKLEWLLAVDSRWQSVGVGFTDINVFMDSIKLDSLKTTTEQRKRIASRIKALQPKVSNRKIAKALGTGSSTIDRDVAPDGASVKKKSNNSNGGNQPPAPDGAPALSGAAAAKAVQMHTNRIERQQERENTPRDYREGGTVEDLVALAATGFRAGVIYPDPPWSFNVYSGKGKDRSADRHYDTQSIDEIAALPVGALAADDCALFMWAVMPELPGAFRVIEAWGFKFKTVAFVWVKQNRSGEGLFTGMGYWTRANAEVCLLATRGEPKRLALDVPQVVLAPVSGHSRKPGEVRERIQRLLGGPYLELYGRGPAPGWTVWGNEVPTEEAEAAE